MKKGVSLIVAAMLFMLPSIASFPAWAQKSDNAETRSIQEKDAIIEKLKAENLQLRKRISTLIDDNNFLNENLMNCTQELNDKDDKAEKK